MSIIGISDEGKLTLRQKTMGQQVKDWGQRAKVEVSQVRIPEFLLRYHSTMIHQQDILD